MDEDDGMERFNELMTETVCYFRLLARLERVTETRKRLPHSRPKEFKREPGCSF